jgi:hypothetical protein
MSVIIVDALPAIRDVLAANSGLVARCTGGDVPSARASETRIYSEELPTNVIASATRPGVLPDTLLLVGAGGGGDTQLAVLSRPRVEVRAYSISRASARALWYAAITVLYGKPPGLSATIWFEASLGYAGPFSGREPQTNWPVASGTLPFLVIGR